MKCLILLSCLLLSSPCLAGSERLALAKNWLATWMPEHFDLDVASSGVKFNGCKQKEYQLQFSQPVGDNFVIESVVSYAKAKLSWGVFSQKLSVKELVFVPRYKLSHNLSLGFGVITQSATEFKSVLGLQFDLPANTEWLVSARAEGFATKHSWELSLSSQKWDVIRNTGTWYETGAANSKISLEYNGFF
ncbi:hypothetical protein L0668_11750 [Paraglaciecola aquimarina]|uniref:Outer membrane protein beta-barrel domain-containing protein n=1 Tax=Paraglaciecola algarum TaxID=3050085 RepID=A0ABS9D7V6_9ALTE|nr:hypothetical protein [Paraglaciecola sp. G1-23]MCF2948784.1 hypothetical protein [Paraglaciecola sp. G1-23]